MVKYALMGFTVETVVSGAPAGVTRSPTWMVAIPAMPSIGEAIRVNPSFTSASYTAALAAATV